MIENLIHTIAKHLDNHKISYMIIGGQAVLIYGRPRLTRDIDITLGIDTDNFEQIDGLCRDLNLKPLTEHPEEFAAQTRVLPVEDSESKVRIDFIFSFTPYEAGAIKRAKSVQIAGYPVKFASCEDIIIHKLVAGRAIDLEDIKSILAKNKKSIDYDYINQWLSDFNLIPEYSDILLKWDKLNKNI